MAWPSLSLSGPVDSLKTNIEANDTGPSRVGWVLDGMGSLSCLSLSKSK